MKQLLIIVYKIYIGGFTIQQTEEYLHSVMEKHSLRNDEELKDNYIIREIFLPLHDGDGNTDIQIIYPLPNYVSPDVNELVNEITQKIKEDPNNQFKSQWERLVRELKIRKLNE